MIIQIMFIRMMIIQITLEKQNYQTNINIPKLLSILSVFYNENE